MPKSAPPTDLRVVCFQSAKIPQAQVIRADPEALQPNRCNTRGRAALVRIPKRDSVFGTYND